MPRWWPFEDDVIIFDLETTGVIITEARIVQLAAVRLSRDGHGDILDVFNRVSNPGIHIPEGASKVHGIYDKDVEKCPTLPDILDQFFDWVGSNNIFTAYNIKYDDGVLNNELERYDYWPPEKPVYKFDTMELAYRLLSPKRIDSFKLVGVADYFKVTTSGAHDALMDVQMTRQVLYGLIEMLKDLPELQEGFENIQEWFTQPFLLPTWPFGKHAGKPSKSLPKGYFQWVVGEMVGDPFFTAQYWLREKYNIF